MKEVKQDTRAKDLETILVLALAVLVVHLVVKNRPFPQEGWIALVRDNVLVFAGCLFLLIGFTSRRLSATISAGWLKFAHLLGSVTNRVILGSLFFLFLTPLSVLYRLFSNNPLQLKREKINGSFFVDRNYTTRKEDFKKMW